ncbi:hypothetical protein F5887DRAFT_1158792 [Amanita rubescens]|nr:hypothetical protein F5887DRAFT_1158792 [Amanita rubescens]
MQDDYSDILGNGALNVKPKSSTSFAVKAAFALFALLVLYVVGLNLWTKFLKWRERSYRLAMRRKHGIPDDDHRPFNVAYAAVQRARQEREALRSAKSRPMNNMPREQPRSSAQLGQDLRQRTGIGRNVETVRVGDRIGVLPGAYRQSPPQNVTAGPSRYNQTISGQSAVYLNDEKVIYARATELVQPGRSGARKATMVMFGGGITSTWMWMTGPVVAENITPKRGSKREFGDADETDDVVASKRAREKRARKVSLEKALSDENMEVDENELEDDADRGHIARGKKRDRDEAGSTFGCDDEDQSELEDVQDDDETRPRSRKRRSVVKKKSDLSVAIRGKKRDRDIDDELSEDADDQASNQTSSRKRRNKREGRLEYVNEDISMDEAVKGRPRKIGEEWTSNGVIYKIGPMVNGSGKLLLKGPGRSIACLKILSIPIVMLIWRCMLKRGLLMTNIKTQRKSIYLQWQDSPKASAERGSHPDHTQPPPSPSGKSLLWKSPAVSTPEGGSPTSELAPITPVKAKGRTNRRIASGSQRVSSVSGVSSPGLVDSTNSSPRSAHRIYSKWEKQDLEASAMMKMREAARKKEAEEKERLEKERLEKERVEREKAEKAKAAAAPPVPTITVTKPPENKPVQAEQKVPDFFAKPPEPAKEPKPAAQPSPFSFKASEEKPATSTASPTPFMPPTKPAEEAKPGEQKPKPSPFVIPQSSGAAAPVTSPVPAVPTTPLFSFPNPAARPEQKPNSNGQASGASLLSRLGSVADTGAPSSTPPTFSFPKPGEAPKSFFGTTSMTPSAPATQTTQSQPVPPTTAPSTTAAPLKFDFKVQNKPAAPTSAPPVLPTSSLAPTAAPDVAKPPVFSATTVAPKFTFGFKSGASQAPSDVKKDIFSFSNINPGTSNGVPSGFSGFNNIPTPSTATSDASSKPLGFGTGGAGFSGFPTSSTATSDASSKPSGLGTGLGTNINVFATGGQSSFGTRAVEPSKFAFGPTPSPQANSATTTADGTNNLFSFSNTTAPAAQTAAPTTLPKFSFDASNSLNKAGATEGAVAAFAAAPTSDAPAPGLVKFGTTSALSGFGGGGSGIFSPSSMSATPFGGAGQSFGFSSMPSATAATASQQSIFGSTSSSTPSTFLGNASGPSNLYFRRDWKWAVNIWLNHFNATCFWAPTRWSVYLWHAI